LKGWLLDTNVVSTLLSDKIAPSVEAWASIQDERRFYLSILTLGEIDKGIFRLPEGDPARAVYAARRDVLEGRFSGRVLPLDDPTVRLWGEISGRVMRETGHPPPVIDTLIAATAIHASLYLVTRNVRDVALSGALVFDPWADDPTNFELTTF
jgi:predicted nucleic acid-binding protein